VNACRRAAAAIRSPAEHLFFTGHVDAAWWVSLFTYNGARGSGSSPYVTGHINALFPWNRVGKDKFEWLGSRKVIRSFPDGMNCVPLMWNYHGEEHPMKAWAGSLCPCISEDGCEVAPATCVGFTIDAPKEELDDTAAKVSAHHRSCPALCHHHTAECASSFWPRHASHDFFAQASDKKFAETFCWDKHPPPPAQQQSKTTNRE